VDDTSQKEQRINIPQDGILPERDAQNNSEQAQLMREAVDEQWRLEHPAVNATVPDFFLEVSTPVVYSGNIGDLVVVPLVKALMFAAEDYLQGSPFTIMTVPRDDDGRSRFLVFYDDDIIRSDFDVAWARALVRSAVEAALELVEMAQHHLMRADTATAGQLAAQDRVSD
jgi:hypothetical protein